MEKELTERLAGVVLLDRNGSVAYPDCALYEVGGNIGKQDRSDICMSFCSLG